MKVKGSGDLCVCGEGVGALREGVPGRDGAQNVLHFSQYGFYMCQHSWSLTLQICALDIC